MEKQEADKIWEKHKEQYPDYAVIPKDSSTFWSFLLSLVSEDEHCPKCDEPMMKAGNTIGCVNLNCLPIYYQEDSRMDEIKLSQQTADKIIEFIESNSHVHIDETHDFINSLVSEDVRNHHRGISFRVNEKTEWECIDLNCTHYDGDRCALEFCDPDILVEGDNPWEVLGRGIRNRLDRGTDKEIAKRILNEFTTWWDNEYGRRPHIIVIGFIAMFRNWLDKDK